MNVFIVYCHPSKDSFTHDVKESFLCGLEKAGHSYTVSDLYAMNFSPLMSEAEYCREAYYRSELPVPDDVRAEHEKINACDAIVFIYPLFWSDAPAMLKGWFDRVWIFGFAYGGNRSMKQLEKALALCIAGNTAEYFAHTGLGESMRKVFLGDRLSDRVKSKEMIILCETSRENPNRELKKDVHLQKAFVAGQCLAGLYSCF